MTEAIALNRLGVESFTTSYVSVGSLIGTKLVDGRILVMTVDEIYDSDADIFVSSLINGIYDQVTDKFTFGTNSYPLIGEHVFKLWNRILDHIFAPAEKTSPSTVGTYIYDNNVEVGYNPNVLFGKHLGVFGNTGSGKTCTVVSIIQNYIRRNPQKNIKFIILDVNGEYRRAFEEDEAEYFPFESLKFHHSILSNPEYGRLFRAAEGVQYPALKDCVGSLKAAKEKWDLKQLSTQIDQWIEDHTDIQNGRQSEYSKNQISGYLRTMCLRIDSIVESLDLMSVINSFDDVQTMEAILSTSKKVVILDLQVSGDSLDIVVYLLFKVIYEHKSHHRDTTHLSLVLEEAHRYINTDAEDSRLGSYYIDKLSREGRKFGVGLIIASQVPSMLAYEVVSQCNSIIMHKITSRRDMEFLRGVLRVSNETLYVQMSALEKQYAVVCGEAFPNDSIVRIHDAMPLPRSNDPRIIDLFTSEEEALDGEEQGKPQEEEPDSLAIKETNVVGMGKIGGDIDDLISQLQESPNFETTHKLIGKLSKNSIWTEHQIVELCRAVENNSQVNWILADSDVSVFYRAILTSTVMPQSEVVQNVCDLLTKSEQKQKENHWNELETGV